MSEHEAVYYLIEYRENNQTVGYLMDLRHGEDGRETVMTMDSSKAMRFVDKGHASNIIDDWEFQRTTPHAENFVIEEHIDCIGPEHAE